MKYLTNTLLWRNKNYRCLFIGQTVSFLGTMVTMVALPYQIYHQTHSTLMVGLLSLAQLLPLLITALLGGVIADRYHRKPLLLITESLLIIGCLVLAINAAAQQPSILILFIAATIMSAITGLHRPSIDSIMQQIVAREDLATMSSLWTVSYSFCMIIGPALAGLIIAHFGLVITYYVDLASFLISLGAIILIKNIEKPQGLANQSTISALTDGFRYAWSRQELLGTYFVDFFAMIFGMPQALFPAIASMHGGAKTLGLFYSAPAVGAFIASFFIYWIKKVSAHGKAIAIAASFWGIAIICFGLAKNIWLALLFLSLAGAADALSGIFRQTLWNQTIPNKFRGRLSGIEMISYLSGPKLGDTEAGLVAAAFGVTASIVSGGILCVVSVAACCYFLPKFWRYRAD